LYQKKKQGEEKRKVNNKIKQAQGKMYSIYAMLRVEMLLMMVVNVFLGLLKVFFLK
jgi:hypothetical protein